MRDTFLFDLDGTLVTMELDFVSIRKAVDSILVEKGYPPELVDARKSTLEVIREAVDYLQTHGLDWEGLKKKADWYLEKVEEEAASKAVLIDGTERVLKLLKERKKKVGVISRNNRRVVLRVLEKCGLTQYVDIILARDDVEKVKPHPDHVMKAVEELGSSPERTVVLGDHHYEIWAGNEAGCLTVGFLTGSGTKESLKDACMILGSIKDLEEVLPLLEQ